MMLVDAHTHISRTEQRAATELAERGLWQLVAATRPSECQQVAELTHSSRRIIPTYGLHPWVTADFPADAMDTWLTEAPIIGEIGLDTVWTDTPLNRQRTAFLHQLRLAVALEKTVILHTKGAEEEILHHLQQHTPPEMIVHWYSGDATLLSGYNALGCYFTLGPDIGQNPAVREVCRQAPLDRLLTETDGTDAVSWALGRACTLADIPGVLRDTLAEVAAIKGLPLQQVQQAVYENLLRVIRLG